MRCDPGGEVISVEAKCPIAAPRNERCSPNSDMRLTTAKRFGRHRVDVTPIRRIQAGRRQQIGEQLLVQPRALSGAVLVEFDCHKSRFGHTRQARNSPGVRIALFEVVQGAVHEVFAHLLPRSGVAQVVRRAGAVDRFDRERFHLGRRGLIWIDAADVAAHAGQEHSFQFGAQTPAASGFHSHAGSTPASPR